MKNTSLPSQDTSDTQRGLVAQELCRRPKPEFSTLNPSHPKLNFERCLLSQRLEQRETAAAILPSGKLEGRWGGEKPLTCTNSPHSSEWTSWRYWKVWDSGSVPHFRCTGNLERFKSSIVQSSATGCQLTPCSAGLLFLISPHWQTENEFLSVLSGAGKSHGPNLVIWGGGSSTGMHLLAKNCFTTRALWAGTLSWCRIYDFFHNSGLFFLTSSQSLVRTSK
jgi:hypothetical protein